MSPLKLARLRRKESLSDTASRVGCTISTLSRIENEHSSASLELAAKLAHHFGISEIQILYPQRYRTY